MDKSWREAHKKQGITVIPANAGIQISEFLEVPFFCLKHLRFR